MGDPAPNPGLVGELRKAQGANKSNTADSAQFITMHIARKKSIKESPCHVKKSQAALPAYVVACCHGPHDPHHCCRHRSAFGAGALRRGLGRRTAVAQVNQSLNRAL